MGAALSPGGFAILSGILSEERSSIEQALEDGGWRVLESDEEGMWWSVVIARS
jgi:ribosomal protein L11 methylase PrmA